MADPRSEPDIEVEDEEPIDPRSDPVPPSDWPAPVEEGEPE
jgi:hypothetical protein